METKSGNKYFWNRTGLVKKEISTCKLEQMALLILLHMETDFWVWNMCFYKWKHILRKIETSTYAKLNVLKDTFANLASCEGNVYLSGKNFYWLKNVINAKRILNKREQIGRKASCHNQRNFALIKNMCHYLQLKTRPSVWSVLVWKWVSTMDVIAWGQSTTIFDIVTPNQIFQVSK